MSVVENLSKLSRKIKVSVPQEQVTEKFDRRINELAKDVNIKGFRKGKVPASVVKLQYGDSVRQEVIQDILYETLRKELKDQNLQPASPPQIEFKNIKEGAPLEYEASFEVYPEVDIDLKGISIERPKASISDEQVGDVIEKLRKQNVKWNDAQKVAEKGDLVVIDFEGFIEGAVFEGGTAKDFKLELGQGMMIPGFEDPILGSKAGDSLEANVTFPEEYHAKQYAGKDAKFKIKVNKIMSPELPELNEAFANDLGVSDGTLAGLRKEVRENLERELERRIRDKVKSQIIEKIVSKNDIEVPETVVNEEIERLQKLYQRQLSAQGSKDIPTLPKENFEEQARKNVVLGLLLSKWVKDNDIKVDSSRVRDRVDQIASGFHQPHDIVNWYYSNKDALDEIEAAVLEDQAIDKLLEVIKVVDKETSFDELMNVDAKKG